MTWSPLPWRESGDGYTIVDSDGVRVASVPYEDDRSYIVEAANAYPGLKARLDKALEACRLLITADGEPNLHRYVLLVNDAIKAAREALEMAEGRNGDGGTSNAQGD